MKSNFTARKQSSIINLRTFHNWTKRELLNQTCSTLKSELDQPITLLDLSCGKAGDLNKWYDNKIMHVVGFDIDSDSINEARSRYSQLINNLKRKNVKQLPVYEFYVMDLSDHNNLPKIEKILHNKKFNIVSCQFAIHYFFKNESSLMTFMTIVNTYIDNHGFFICTTVNGSSVVEKLQNKSSIGNDIYTIEKKYNEPIISPYGNTYLVALGEESDTEHYFANKKSEEYIVDIEELKIICAKMNLLYIGAIDFETWYKSFGKNIMSQNEIEYSYLNFSFVFKKIVV
jgi:mRNA (guanine-N7-)-methyltransferase